MDRSDSAPLETARQLDSRPPRLVRQLSYSCFAGSAALVAGAVGVMVSWGIGEPLSLAAILLGVVVVFALLVLAVVAVAAGLSVVQTGRLGGVWAVTAGTLLWAGVLSATADVGLWPVVTASLGVGYGVAAVWMTRRGPVRVWLAHRRDVVWRSRRHVRGLPADWF